MMETLDYCELAVPGVRALRPYTPGKPIDELEREYGVTDSIKLASNENPLGASPNALAAVREALDGVWLYPDANGFHLKSALAEKHGVSPECITLGNGSNDVLVFLAQAMLQPGLQSVFSQYCFAVYPIASEMVGAEAVVAPALPEDHPLMPLGHDLRALFERVGPDTRMVWIANPNNPTGTWLEADRVQDFLASLPGHVICVVDEAYTEYAESDTLGDASNWLERFPNLVVTRTFSKAYGLAGLRVGYALSNPGLADLLNRVRPAFNVNSLGLAAARAALDRQGIPRALAPDEQRRSGPTDRRPTKARCCDHSLGRKFFAGALRSPRCGIERGAAAARHHRAPDRELWAGQLSAHQRGHSGAESAPAFGNGGNSSGFQVSLVVKPAAAPLVGRVVPPGDKSISHRAAIFGGLAHGTTRIEGFLAAEDTLATLAAMADLGARVERDEGSVEIEGAALRAPARALDLGNSGTGMRLLAGALCGHPDLFGASVELNGDASLSRRPMKRIIEPLGAMGAVIESRQGRAPLVVRPNRLRALAHRLSVASAQVKSAILLAGLNADGYTGVIEPGTSRDHTERLLPAFGVDTQRSDNCSDNCSDTCSDNPSDNRSGNRAGVTGPARLEAASIAVPGDLSSAAFMLAASLLVPGSRVVIGPTGVNPTRDGFLRIVERMAGSAVLRHPLDGAGAEPVAMLEVKAPDRLVGINVPPAWAPLAIDEFPLVMAMAAVAEGRTVVTGAEELRVKESDRLAVMCRQLGRLGVRIEEHADGATIYGGRVRGGTVDADGDHRIAMSLAVLALVAEAPVEITDAEWIRTSYPAFVAHLKALGGRLQWQ